MLVHAFYCLVATTITPTTWLSRAGRPSSPVCEFLGCHLDVTKRATWLLSLRFLGKLSCRQQLRLWPSMRYKPSRLRRRKARRKCSVILNRLQTLRLKYQTARPTNIVLNLFEMIVIAIRYSGRTRSTCNLKTECHRPPSLARPRQRFFSSNAIMQFPSKVKIAPMQP